MPRAGSAETDRYTYDPNNPVPTLGGNSCCAALTPTGPWDQRAAEPRRRPGVQHRGAEGSRGGHRAGDDETLAATSARDTDWTAKLVDVGPNGFARNVQEGIIRARYRNAIGKPGMLLEPNRVYGYTVDMWAGSNVFLPGHQIRLEISSSNFPGFDRNLNTGEDAATGTRIERAQQTIHHSAQYPLHVIFPIVIRESRTLSTSVR